MAPLLERETELHDLGRLLDQASDGSGLVVIEGIPWADGASLDLVRFLSRRLDSVRAMLLLTYRTDELRSVDPALIAVGDVSSLPWARRITLGGLSRKAVALLTSGTRL